MNWDKLRKAHLRKEPVEFIYASGIVKLDEYDRLYENQNNLEHQVWKDFYEKYKVNFKFYKDLSEFDNNKEVICLWFFRERADRYAGGDIDIDGKLMTYTSNTFLITKFKKIKMLTNKKHWPHRPFLQLDMSEKTFDEIVEKLR